MIERRLTHSRRADLRPLDLIIVGGGLRGSLLAIALAERRPDVAFVLIEESSNFGGGPIDPFFWEHLPVSGRGLIADAVVSEWAICLIAFEQKVERQAWSSAAVTPAQLHADVLQRVPARHLLAQCQSRFVIGRIVITSRGTYQANHVIDFSRRHDAVGPQLWCISADFELPDHQHFPVPILADVGGVGQRWITQYIPSACFNVTVRTLSVGDFASERGLLGTDVVASVTSYASSVSEGAIPGLPANPLLPSRMYEAVEMAEALVSCDFGPGASLAGVWDKLRSTWRRRSLSRVADLRDLGDAQSPDRWRALSDAGEPLMLGPRPF